ncbi:MAG: aromatic aminobenezylarsenical efflux permease ArsG family transporter [Candidatus Gracilibacteria bacterium]|nr:aromatic aminobenezylarsenical efflux permease ArsG family transporter [Candidatus Gracilibacteria bacterium]MDD4530414.1 aromatic aminobenezylarsenical efflux permease ArsG family transporter [Candidatus Gracilibacteria bacterium]
MIDYINLIIDNYNIPLLTAFLIGIMTSISPCPLATNITAISYISKDIKNPKKIIIHGFFYTLGRVFSYTMIASLIYYGFSQFQISKIFQGWGDKILGIILVFIGLVMLDIVKINFGKGSKTIGKIKEYLSNKGYVGTFLLGALFALAFCPYSGVLYFGVLIPLVLNSSSGLLLPSVFALGTSIPVLIFAFIFAFSVSKLSKVFNEITKIEKYLRYFIAGIFIIVGTYYLQFTLKFLLGLF